MNDSHHFRLGMFIVGGILALVTVLVVMGIGNRLRPTIGMETYIDGSVQGLDLGAPIKFPGVTIGSVTRLGSTSVEYESDFYNEWFLSPREHVEQLLRERWTRERAAVTLVADARTDPGARQLDVLVTAFHGDLQGGGDGMARVGLRVFAQGEGRTWLWNLERDVPMTSRSPEALVAALSSGMAAVMEELERRLQE